MTFASFTNRCKGSETRLVHCVLADSDDPIEIGLVRVLKFELIVLLHVEEPIRQPQIVICFFHMSQHIILGDAY